MSTFEYAMVLISIIVGLGIAHILSALGSAVQRLRGFGPAIHLGITYLSWVAFVFFWLVSFWWFEFKWRDIAPEFGLLLFLFLVTYAVALFLLTVILVPHHLEVVDDSREYFVSIRGWFYGGLLAVNGIDLADTFLKGFEWGTRSGYIVYWSAVTGAAILGLITKRQWVHSALGIGLLVYAIVFTALDTPTLGRW
jgi:hypothetical protein